MQIGTHHLLTFPDFLWFRLILQYFIDEFPQNQTLYTLVISTLRDILELTTPFASRGWQGEEFVPLYILDTAGNMMDIIKSEMDNATLTEKEYMQRKDTLKKMVL